MKSGQKLKFRTVVIENPARLGYESGYMVVRTSDSQVRVHLSEIQMVLVASQQSHISAYLLGQLAAAKISLIVVDEKANPVGQFLPLCGAHNMSKRLREQLEWGEVIKKQVWRFIVQDKISKQAGVLLENDYVNEAKLLMDISRSVRSGDSDNREAYAARIYFETLFGQGFTRSVPCPVNAALNYGYAIILSAVNREIVSRGYLMQLGIHHRSEFNRFNLGCDFMESFRPLIDSCVLGFSSDGFGSDEKHLLQSILSMEVYYSGGRFALKSVIGQFVGECTKTLNLDKPISELISYETV